MARCWRTRGVVVAGARVAVATVVAAPADETAAVAVSTVALVARRRPRLGHVGTDRGQHCNDHDRGRQQANTARTGRSHRQAEIFYNWDADDAPLTGVKSTDTTV